MLLDCCTGATALQTSVLTAELNRVLQLDKLELAKGRNCTLTLDGWSPLSMESLYGFLVLFPDGRSILHKAEDYSDQTHSGRFLAGKQVQVLQCIVHGPDLMMSFSCRRDYQGVESSGA